MDEDFELLDPQGAQGFLQRFPAQARRQGESLVRIGAVQQLSAPDPGFLYSAVVRNGGLFAVELEYDPVENEWLGSCDCPSDFLCGHLYATMSALLAEHRTATVRRLSAGLNLALGAPGARTRPGAPDSTDMVRRLQAAKGSPLTSEEQKFLRDLHQVYGRCVQSRQIGAWDFQQLGLPLSSYAWGPLKIWPSFPANEHEFWLYVANALRERNIGIPEFMLPVTDLSAVAEPLNRWRRAEEVAKWKQALENLPPAPVSAVAAKTDLRLVVEETGIRLQWQRPGHDSFENCKQQQVRQFVAEHARGVVSLTPEAEMLWQLFRQALPYGLKATADYADENTTRMLGWLFRMQSLDAHVVTTQGQPLARPAEPLRWELGTAANAEEDYRLRLIQADGRSVPPVLAILNGQPALYLTANALFTGPPAPENLLTPDAENRIPAPAIESSSGVRFLNSLGIGLPEKLGERVRVLPYQIAVSCELKPVYVGAQTENCAVSVLAEAPDGSRLGWDGEGWDEESRGAGRRMRHGPNSEIRIYDSARLAQAAALMAPLHLKAQYTGELALPVNKKFPEIFAAWLKSLPPDFAVHLKDDLASFLSADVAGRVKLDVTEAGIDWFDLRVVLDVADTTLTSDEIKLLLKARGKYVRLAGKGWRRLQYDLGQQDQEQMARLGLSPQELSDEPQRLHALQLADEAAKRFLPASQVERIQRRASELKARVAPDLPAGVTAQMRPYQLEGFHFLAYLSTNRFGGILADDMGLGKTLQALTWLCWLRALGGNGGAPAPALVVCPKSVMDNWHAEAGRFTPGLRVRVWSAGELPSLQEQATSAELHVLNYSQLRSVSSGAASINWLAVILDEGQYIKNPNSQTAQVARSLKADHRLILSGTPIENRLLDLWSLMSFAMPGVLNNRAQFARLYDSKGDPFARRRLAARVRPFVLRRTKAQVAKDLPDRVEEDLFCEIEGEQQSLYRAELKRAQQMLLGIKTQAELAKQQFNFLTSLLRLRQICCHPRLVNPESSGSSAKTEALLDQLEPLMDEGEKVLVFSQFVEMLDLLRPALQERQWPHFYLSGQTENRGELVRQFQAAEGPAVFLISLKAGGFGLNLTAASYVVLFDPWWNPAVEAQAIDRTHRIGQTNKVIAYRLLIKNSIEEKIRTLQKQKKALAEDVLGEEKFAQSLTLDDLRFLLAD